MPQSTITPPATGLAAIAAAAAGDAAPAPSDADIAAAAATPPASPAPSAASDGQQAPAEAPAAQAAAISASTALELAALALPSVRAQLGELANAASLQGATEASYRTACLKVAAGPASAGEPLRTQTASTGVSKPEGKAEAPQLSSTDDIYASRQKAMAAS